MTANVCQSSEDCPSPVHDGEKYCDYHKWFAGVMIAIYGSIGILFLMMFVSTALPQSGIFVAIFGILAVPLWLYLAIKNRPTD